jgi:hypothetical protein
MFGTRQGLDKWQDAPWKVVVPRASPKSAEHSEFRVITTHAQSLRKSTHFLHQYMSPFTMLPSVLFYKEGLYIFTQHSSKHWCGSPFTGLPHHHLVRVRVNTSILILIVSILLYFLQASLIAYAIWQGIVASHKCNFLNGFERKMHTPSCMYSKRCWLLCLCVRIAHRNSNVPSGCRCIHHCQSSWTKPFYWNHHQHTKNISFVFI